MCKGEVYPQEICIIWIHLICHARQDRTKAGLVSLEFGNSICQWSPDQRLLSAEFASTTVGFKSKGQFPRPTQGNLLYYFSLQVHGRFMKKIQNEFLNSSEVHCLFGLKFYGQITDDSARPSAQNYTVKAVAEELQVVYSIFCSYVL